MSWSSEMYLCWSWLAAEASEAFSGCSTLSFKAIIFAIALSDTLDSFIVELVSFPESTDDIEALPISTGASLLPALPDFFPFPLFMGDEGYWQL